MAQRRHIGPTARTEGGRILPLDPSSPTVKVEMRIPRDLRDAIDRAAAEQGINRSEWIRRVTESAL